MSHYILIRFLKRSAYECTTIRTHLFSMILNFRIYVDIVIDNSFYKLFLHISFIHRRMDIIHKNIDFRHFNLMSSGPTLNFGEYNTTFFEPFSGHIWGVVCKG